MDVFAAVMTGQGTGAISTIQVFGNLAPDIIRKIFKPLGNKPAVLRTGTICLGIICDGNETIDQVTIGCESANNFAINCHGNPLIVEMIMQLLGKYGVTLITTEQMLAKILAAEKLTSSIELEAKLAQIKAKTIEGAKIIINQIDAGLVSKAKAWQKNIDTMSPDKITTEAEQILQKSQPAKLIMYGCTIVLAGPPNTGKSTLLNYLAGKSKAIVSDVKGTTRDWVSSICQIGSLSAELIDTAGLDEQLSSHPRDPIAKEAQKKSVQLLENADLVLLVLDNSQPACPLNDVLLEKIAGKKVLTVLNKSDLPAGLNAGRLPETLTNTVRISAKFGAGIENLLKKIQQLAATADFDLKSPVCFTSRQENLLRQLGKAKSKDKTLSIITELLNGQLSV